MALKSNPVMLGATDTVIYQAPVDAGAVVQPYVANVHATLTRTYQLRLFKQSTGLTTTLGPPSAPLAALAPLAKIPLAVSMEAGDRLIGVASAASSIVVTPFIDISRSSVAKGFNARGVWASGTTYAENDVVYLASTGASYISIQDVNVGNSPDTSPAYWMVSAAQGVPGTAGVAGASSLQIVRVMSSGPAGPLADFESGDTIDGVTLATNDLVFRNSTASPELNGIYVASASGAAARHSEYDTFDEHPGRVFSVMEGTVYADTLWQCTSNAGGVLDTNPLTFVSILDAAVAISGDTMTGALTLPGNPTTALQAAPKQYVDAHDARRNRIVNGAMQISQENGDTAGTGSNYFAADQWFQHAITAGTITFQRVQSVTPNGSKDRLRQTITVADAALAAGDYLVIIQPIEGSQVADFRYGSVSAKQIILRFGWKSPAGTYSLQLLNSAVNRSYVVNFTISSGQANTETEQTLIIPGDITGTWLTDTGKGLSVIFVIAAGSALQGTTGWQSGNIQGTSSNTNGMATIGSVYELFDVGLYLDADNTGVPPKWEMPDPVQELATCQRYFYSAPGPIGVYHYGVLGSSPVFAGLITFPVTMRTIPTNTFPAAATYINCTSGGVYSLTHQAVTTATVTASGNYLIGGGIYNFNSRM